MSEGAENTDPNNLPQVFVMEKTGCQFQQIFVMVSPNSSRFLSWKPANFCHGGPRFQTIFVMGFPNQEIFVMATIFFVMGRPTKGQ